MQILPLVKYLSYLSPTFLTPLLPGALFLTPALLSAIRLLGSVILEPILTALPLLSLALQPCMSRSWGLGFHSQDLPSQRGWQRLFTHPLRQRRDCFCSNELPKGVWEVRDGGGRGAKLFSLHSFIVRKEPYDFGNMSVKRATLCLVPLKTAPAPFVTTAFKHGFKKLKVKTHNLIMSPQYQLESKEE